MFSGNDDFVADEKPSIFEDFAVKVIDPVKQGDGVAVCFGFVPTQYYNNSCVEWI